jgi:hypothetical protein
MSIFDITRSNPSAGACVAEEIRQGGVSIKALVRAVDLLSKMSQTDITRPPDPGRREKDIKLPSGVGRLTRRTTKSPPTLLPQLRCRLRRNEIGARAHRFQVIR